MEKRILIADDHGVVRLDLSMMIKKLRPDFIVDEADDYQKVMSIIKVKSFDLAMPLGNYHWAYSNQVSQGQMILL